jgi:hypothetical protein
MVGNEVGNEVGINFQSIAKKNAKIMSIIQKKAEK